VDTGIPVAAPGLNALLLKTDDKIVDSRSINLSLLGLKI
jgi:hypothetical protein